MTVICYKVKEPIIYNKNTKYESRCDTFLSYYTYKNKNDAQIECDKLNTERPNKLWNGTDINWDVINYFYVDEQEPMEG